MANSIFFVTTPCVCQLGVWANLTNRLTLNPDRRVDHCLLTLPPQSGEVLMYALRTAKVKQRYAVADPRARHTGLQKQAGRCMENRIETSRSWLSPWLQFRPECPPANRGPR